MTKMRFAYSMLVALSLSLGTPAMAKQVTFLFPSNCSPEKLKQIGGPGVLGVKQKFRCGNLKEAIVDDSVISQADYLAKVKAAQCIHARRVTRC